MKYPKPNLSSSVEISVVHAFHRSLSETAHLDKASCRKPVLGPHVLKYATIRVGKRLKKRIVKAASLKPIRQIELPSVPSAKVETVVLAAIHLRPSITISCLYNARTVRPWP